MYNTDKYMGIESRHAYEEPPKKKMTLKRVISAVRTHERRETLDPLPVPQLSKKGAIALKDSLSQIIRELRNQRWCVPPNHISCFYRYATYLENTFNKQEGVTEKDRKELQHVLTPMKNLEQIQTGKAMMPPEEISAMSQQIFLALQKSLVPHDIMLRPNNDDISIGTREILNTPTRLADDTRAIFRQDLVKATEKEKTYTMYVESHISKTLEIKGGINPDIDLSAYILDYSKVGGAKIPWDTESTIANEHGNQLAALAKRVIKKENPDLYDLTPHTINVHLADDFDVNVTISSTLDAWEETVSDMNMVSFIQDSNKPQNIYADTAVQALTLTAPNYQTTRIMAYLSFFTEMYSRTPETTRPKQDAVIAAMQQVAKGNANAPLYQTCIQQFQSLDFPSRKAVLVSVALRMRALALQYTKTHPQLAPIRIP